MKLAVPSPRSLGVAAVVGIGIALLAGSVPTSTVSPKENAGLERVVGKVDQDGGNLVLGSSRLCDSFDPAASFDSWCGVVFRLYARNLMAFSGQPGTASLQTQPDLAIGAPKVNADKTKWSFKIRKNVRWDNGKAVTAQDVKYSIERLYAPAIQGTVSEKYLCLLSTCSKGIPTFSGPDKHGKKQLPTIATFGPNTIVFSLKSPSVDFDKVLALPQFSVIQKSRDLYLRGKKKSYALNPGSNGPFVLHLDRRNRIAKFTRNNYWVQASDAIRAPHVASISWKVISDLNQLNSATLKNKIDVRLGEDFAVGPELKVLAKSKQTQFDHPLTGFTNFLVVRPQKTPLNRIACRQAIFYAIDKAALQNIRGGATNSQIATSLLPSNIAGYDPKNDIYQSATNLHGNVQQATAALKQCGYPEGFEITMAYLNLGVGPEIFRSIQASLAQVGIVVAPKRFDNYSEFILSTRNVEELANQDISLVVSGAQSNIGSPSDYWADFVDSRLIKPFGNQNLAVVDNPTINSKLDAMVTSPEQTSSLSADINDIVMNRAVYLPYGYDRILMYRNPKVLGIYIQQALDGQYDIVNVGLPAN